MKLVCGLVPKGKVHNIGYTRLYMSWQRLSVHHHMAVIDIGNKFVTGGRGNVSGSLVRP
jgi:hypothetical protein